MSVAASSQTRCQQCPLKRIEVFRAVSPAELTFIEHFKSGEFITDERRRRSAIERVAYVLLDLYLRARHLELTTTSRLKIPFTQQHLVDALGLSLVHTNKTLNALTARKLIRWKPGVLEFLDQDTLAQLANHERMVSPLLPLI